MGESFATKITHILIVILNLAAEEVDEKTRLLFEGVPLLSDSQHAREIRELEERLAAVVHSWAFKDEKGDLQTLEYTRLSFVAGEDYAAMILHHFQTLYVNVGTFVPI